MSTSIAPDRSLLNSLKSSTTLVSLAVAENLSSLLLPLTKLLQSKSIDLIVCCSEVDDLISILRKQRGSDSSFNEIFSSALHFCSIVGIDMTIPRTTSKQLHWSNIVNVTSSSSDSTSTSCKDDYSRISIYNPFLDFLLTELSDRFTCHRSNAFLLQMFFPASSFQYNVSDLTPVFNMYDNVLPGCISQLRQEFHLRQEKCRKGKLTANNAVDALEQCTNNYTNIKLRLKVLNTLPVTTASAERTFSMLRRLKTWLRSTMAEDRLTGLALLASCTDITVTPDAVLDIFFRTSRRILNQL